MRHINIGKDNEIESVVLNVNDGMSSYILTAHPDGTVTVEMAGDDRIQTWTPDFGSDVLARSIAYKFVLGPEYVTTPTTTIGWPI